jgi:glycosyltransferase involved in cell wall biosynthesis
MGVKVAVCDWDRERKFPLHFSIDGIEYRMIFRGWGYANRSLIIGLPLWMLRLWLYLLGRRPDLVMALDFDTALPMAMANLVTQVPFIYNIRDNYAMRSSVAPGLARIVSSVDRWIIRRAVKVIVPDESRITETDERLREKFVVIRNCAPDVKPPAILADRRPFTVYAMGYVRRSRGIGLLLEAACRLSGVRILLAGNVDEVDLRSQIEKDPNVDFRGFLPVEEALKLCYESDVIFTFYAPDSEINRRAISNKWSDAMMASKPILVNSEILKSEWIKREDIGYLCPYGDVNRLVHVLEYIRQHPEEARHKGARGRQLYEAGYSWPKMERRLCELLRELKASLLKQ